jgi:tryptophan synthase alpha chain
MRSLDCAVSRSPDRIASSDRRPIRPDVSPSSDMNRIDALFARLRRESRRALMPFVTAGDPDLGTTAALIDELLGRAGAHMVEIGIPYSDPIADGPVIAASYTRALRKGIKLSLIFEMIRRHRADHAEGPQADAPLVTMISYAIVHRHGVDRYLAEAVEAGVDGLIVPDLPVEEAEGVEGLKARTDAAGLRLIQLVTPTTPRERAVRIARSSSGFLYYVSIAGITGERAALPPELAENVAWLRTQTDLPICVGFGISRPEHIRQLAPVADGLIVGSAIVRRIAELEERDAPGEVIVDEVGRFVGELASALPADRSPRA